MESPATANPRETNMNTKWNHATIPADSITAREERRAEDERGCGPIDFELTPQERDIARLAMVEILAKRQKAGAK